MTKKKKIQKVAIALLIIAVILLLPSIKWADKTTVWGFIGLLFGTLGSIISIFIPTSFTLKFSNSDWQSNNDGYSLVINSTKHGVGKSPQVQIYKSNGNAYVQVEVESNHDDNGNITLLATMNFSGKVIVL